MNRVRAGGDLIRLLLTVLVILATAAPGARGQGLAEFDYENLSFRGVMLDVGHVSSPHVESTVSLGGRMDFGFLGPGVRVVMGLNHWSSELDRGRVAGFEESLEALVLEQTGEAADISLGEVSWSDVALSGDAHYLWRVPFGLLTYAGLGGTAHVLRGSGDAIDGTFVDDLLDSVRAGLNVHAGLELPVRDRFRVVGEARYEWLEDLRYLQLRVGGQLMFGALAPGESRDPD